MTETNTNTALDNKDCGCPPGICFGALKAGHTMEEAVQIRSLQDAGADVLASSADFLKANAPAEDASPEAHAAFGRLVADVLADSLPAGPNGELPRVEFVGAFRDGVPVTEGRPTEADFDALGAQLAEFFGAGPSATGNKEDSIIVDDVDAENEGEIERERLIVGSLVATVGDLVDAGNTISLMIESHIEDGASLDPAERDRQASLIAGALVIQQGTVGLANVITQMAQRAFQV